MFDIDKIDISILQSIEKKPGQHLIEYLRPLLKTRSTRALYDRICMLAVQGLITIDRQKKYSYATITQKGREKITGREESPSVQEARSS